MRVTKAVAAVALLIWTVQCVGVVAQDDLDLEALLDDLTEPAEEVIEEQPAVVEDIVDADMLVEEDVVIEAPELTDMPEMVEEVEMFLEEDTSLEDLLEEPELEPVEFDEDIEGLVDEVLEEAESVDEAMAEEIVEEAMAEEIVEEAAPAEMAEAEEVAEEVVEAEPAMSGAATAMAAQEEVKRQAKEVKGLKSLQLGFQALDQGKYEEALESFEESISNIPERRATIGDIQRAKWGASEAHYKLAVGLYKDDAGDIGEARGNAQSALRYVPDHQGAIALLRKIEKKEERLSRMAAMPVPVKQRAEIVEREGTIEELIKEGKQYYAIGDYELAEALFDQVLLTDEFNTDAMRYLKRIKDKEFKISTLEREATVANAMREVRDSWNPPIKEEVELPTRAPGQSAIVTKTQAEKLREKMEKIIIPSIEFRHANIRDVVNFLVEASIAGDKEGIGVNIVLNLNLPDEAMDFAPAPEPAREPMDDMFEMDEFDDFFEEAPEQSAPMSSGGGASSIPTITLNLRRISLHEALKIITEVSGLKHRLDGNVVIITPAGASYGAIVTRMYPVQPSILDVIVEREEETERGGDFIEMGGNRTSMRRGDVKDFFQKSGVPFPIGTSITYNPGISQLIVANTPDNLEIFERILAQLNVIPQQVEIEARFVEIAQSDLQELGMQWMLTDNWEIAQRNGNAPIAGQERVQVNADSDGFSQGLRFWNTDRTTGAVLPLSPVTQGIGQSAMGSILSISSILTNPELTVVLQALDQQGGADLLSAPRVTTRSGVNAQIQVVREIIYPTEFEVTQPTIQSEGNLVTPPTVTPGGFETRETGVILNVTPTVGPDGYTIDLTMIPEVSELVDWIQYGSEVTLPTQGAGDRTFTFNIPQPIFSSRHVTTSIVIWDGQTVVMGGLIREDLQTIEDKIPLLGDIPIIGRLFRTEGEFGQKRNLVIFVTARLVDPAGKPIHKMDQMAMPGGGTQTTETPAQ